MVRVGRYPASTVSTKVASTPPSISKSFVTPAVSNSSVTTGASCDTFHQQAGRCVKGAVVYGQAPGRRSLLFRDLVYDAFFDAQQPSSRLAA